MTLATPAKSLTEYDYNPVSQIIERDRDNSAYDRVLPSSTSGSYAVNGLDDYTAVPVGTPAYSDRGMMTDYGTLTHTYNATHRLHKTPSFSPDSDLAYDLAGRLWEEILPASTAHFLYDGQDMIAEYNTAGEVLRRYVHGPGLDEPLVWYEGSGTSNKQYFLADESGSVIGIANNSGTVTQVNTNDTFGLHGIQINTGNSFTHTGEGSVL